MSQTNTPTPTTIEEHFELEATKEYNAMVQTYIEQHDTAPFTDMQFKENGSMDVDFADDFYDITTSKFGKDLQPIVEDYFNGLFKTLIEEQKLTEDFTTDTTDTKDTNDSK